MGYTQYLSPECGCVANFTRYAARSHIDVMSLRKSPFMRSEHSPSAHSPAVIFSNSERFVSTERSRNGLAAPSGSGVSLFRKPSRAHVSWNPCRSWRLAAVSSLVWWHTYAFPRLMSSTASSCRVSK